MILLCCCWLMNMQIRSVWNLLKHCQQCFIKFQTLLAVPIKGFTGYPNHCTCPNAIVLLAYSLMRTLLITHHPSYREYSQLWPLPPQNAYLYLCNKAERLVCGHSWRQKAVLNNAWWPASTIARPLQCRYSWLKWHCRKTTLS